MAFCATCGAPVEGRFCAKCGSAATAGGSPSGAASAGAAPQPMPAATPMADNLASALCYLAGLITGIIFLVVAPYSQNRTVRFHAFQAIFFNVAWIACWIVINMILGMMHLIGAFGILMLSPLIGLAFFVLWLYLMISAYQGKTVVLPLIGPLAQQQAMS